MIDVIREDGVKYYNQKVVDHFKRDAYSTGFNDGLRIEIHFVCIDGNIEISDQDKELIKLKLKAK